MCSANRLSHNDLVGCHDVDQTLPFMGPDPLSGSRYLSPPLDTVIVAGVNSNLVQEISK
jgi:hypothetical protein